MGRAWAFSSYSTPQGISPLLVYITSNRSEFHHKLHLLIWLLPWDIQHLFLGFQKQHQKGDPLNLPFWDLSCFAFPSLGGRRTRLSSGQARNTSGHSWPWAPLLDLTVITPDTKLLTCYTPGDNLGLLICLILFNLHVIEAPQFLQYK